MLNGDYFYAIDPPPLVVVGRCDSTQRLWMVNDNKREPTVVVHSMACMFAKNFFSETTTVMTTTEVATTTTAKPGLCAARSHNWKCFGMVLLKETKRDD